MKRGIGALEDDTEGANGSPSKKKATTTETISSRFRDGLFAASVLEEYTQDYKSSQPYKHGVISNVVSNSLLRNVRNEIQQHLSFSPKETDIYKIHQSGDLANLDGLDDSSLALLPSLLKLRDALYSASFREYLSHVTSAGHLSGSKTDMAINVYTPGCHLLCHDDVIGSRRLSYILYLTDPDRPWKKEWGGALRLYPTLRMDREDGKTIRVPSPDYSVSIPPAFNQLSFFAVQPGESFHDVEEVYHQEGEPSAEDDIRVRMAISGWYHIPQQGEEGYEEGLEEKLAEKSSLAQLQGNAEEFDLPQPSLVSYSQPDVDMKGAEDEGADELELTEADLNHLLPFISPTYLTPDAAEELEERFTEDSLLILDRILSEKFAKRLHDFIDREERIQLSKSSKEIENSTSWKVARPPHKHRYLFQQYSEEPRLIEKRDKSPLHELLEDLLPSRSFSKWLRLVTGSPRLLEHDFMARRFRKGEDYQLATTYDGDDPKLEITLALSPGWVTDGNEDDDNQALSDELGGYEVYMGGDDDDNEDSVDYGKIPAKPPNGSKKPKDDPAVYRASANEDDDGILLSMPAAWNKISIVLRDKGTMKFVKYVSKKASSDRWDITGTITVDPQGWDAEENSVGRRDDTARTSLGRLNRSSY